MRRPLRLLAAMTALPVVLTVVTTASATYPGRNGRLAFVRTTPPCKWDRVNDEWICQGAIWTANADGSGLRQVSQNWVSNPSWSPDGSKLAYLSPEGIWTADASGGNRRLVTRQGILGQPVSWTPDGKRLLFATSRTGSYQVKSVDLGGRHEIVHLRTTSLLQPLNGPQFSPDGRRLAFVGRRYLSRDDWRNALYVADANGSRRRRLADVTIDNGRWFDWSPDGKRIVYLAPQTWDVPPEGSLAPELWIVNTDGTGRRRITDGGRDRWNITDPSWAPDGRTIVFKRSTRSEPIDSRELAMVSPEGGGIRSVLFGVGCTIPASGPGAVPPKSAPCEVWHPAWGARR